MLRLEIDGVRWELQPGFDRLLEKTLSSPGEVVKESPAKLVTRHEMDGRVCYIKRYRHAAVPLRPIKYCFKSSQARNEWELAQRLDQLGIPVVPHLALGERKGFGVQESILITEGFAGRPLEETRHPEPAAVLEFVRQMHERGVLQTDLHPGNILLAPSGEMRLVDLHGTVVKPALTPEERALNLARLCVSYSLPVSAEIAALSARLRRDLFRNRSRRCLKRNREFVPERFGGLRWRVRRTALSSAVRAILAGPDRFLAERGRILKAGRSATVGSGDGLVLKRFSLRKPESLAKDMFRPSRARRAFRAAYHLELAGIPTARPLATADRRVCGILLRSYLLMEEIAGAVDLGAYLRRGRVPEPKLVETAARLIAQLHEEGFTHRDLKESNLLLSPDGHLYLIDLDGLKYLGVVPDRRAAADLARLGAGMRNYAGISDAHRWRFMKAYCQARKRTVLPRL